MILFKALYDYESKEPNDLSFKSNDIIELLSKTSADWYVGRNLITRKSGSFPFNFVAEVKVPSDVDVKKLFLMTCGTNEFAKGTLIFAIKIGIDSIVGYALSDPNKYSTEISKSMTTMIEPSVKFKGFSKCIARTTYVAKRDNELSFAYGDVIWLKERVNDVFAEGLFNGQRGLFPLSYVDIEEDIDFKENSFIDRRNRWIAQFDFISHEPNDLSARRGDKLKFIDRIDNNWFLMQNAQGQVGMIPSNYLKNISINSPPSQTHLQQIPEQPQKSYTFLDQLKSTHLQNVETSDSGLLSNENLTVDNNDSDRENIYDEDDVFQKPFGFNLDLSNNDETIESLNDRIEKLENNIEIVKNDIQSVQKKINAEDVKSDESKTMTNCLAFLQEDFKSKNEELCCLKEKMGQLLKSENESDSSNYTYIHTETPQEKKVFIRNRAIEELKDTELTYVNDLKLTLECFNRDKNSKKILDDDFQLLFGDLDCVLALAETFYHALVNVVESATEEICIGCIFLKYLNEFEEVYKEYCINYDRKVELINKKSKNQSFSAFVDEGLSKLVEFNSINRIDAMLVKPLQRFLKYPLLLKMIIENTPDDHPDFKNVTLALLEFEKIAKKINEKKRFEELRSYIFEKNENWHSKTLHAIQKVPKRLIFQSLYGSPDDDVDYQEAVTTFKNLRKSISFFIETVIVLRDNLKDVLNGYSLIAENLSFVAQTGFGSELQQYVVICKNSELEYQKKYYNVGSQISLLEKLVVSPLNGLLDIFSGPKILIKKRHAKFLDFLALKQKADSNMKDVTRTFLDKVRELESQYLAINNTLKEELPVLTAKGTVIFNECLANYLQLTTSTFRSTISSLSSLVGSNSGFEECMKICKNQQNEIISQLQRKMSCHKLASQTKSISSEEFLSKRKNLCEESRNSVYFQTADDVIFLKKKFNPPDLATVRKDFMPTKIHQLHVCAGNTAGIIKRCDPQGHGSSWLLMTSPKRVGFVPRSYITQMSSFDDEDTANHFDKSMTLQSPQKRFSLVNPTTNFDLMDLSTNEIRNPVFRMSLCENPIDSILKQENNNSSMDIRVALYRHTSRNASEISMEKNDKLELIRGSDKSGNTCWSFVKNIRTGAVGYAPTNYLSR